MKRWADEDGRRMLSELGAWMAEQIVEVQKTHIKAFKATIA